MSKRVIQIGAGGYGQTEYQGGLLGGAEYARAQMESEMVRSGSKPFAASVRGGETMYSEQTLAPAKPAAVALSGYDLFGPQSLGSTTRNMSLDLRGEVVSVAQATSATAPPSGGGYVGSSGVVAEKPLSSTLRSSRGAVGHGKSGGSRYGIGTKIDYSSKVAEAMPSSTAAPLRTDVVLSRREMYPNVTKTSPKVNHVQRMVQNVGAWTKSLRFPWMKK